MRSAFSERLRDEQGQALILAIVIIVVGLLLGVGAVAYALNATRGSVRDERVRAAQQGADAGVSQQLYLQSDSAAVGYDIPGSGTLGVSAVIDCVLPPTSVPSASSLIGYVNSLGQCVPLGSSTTNKCTTCAPAWNPAGNEAYYQAEYFPNGVQQSTSTSTGNSFKIDFPEIVSLGCHTTTAPTTATPTAATAACNSDTGDAYSRRLALLQPTAPLQAIEAGNDATVYGTGLAAQVVPSALYTLAGEIENNPALSGVIALCTSPTLTALLSTLSAILDLLNLHLTLTAVQTDCSSITALLNVAVINGNVSAGHDMYLPTTVVGLNTTGIASTTAGLLSAVDTIVSTLGSVATNLANASSTFEYGDSNGSDTGAVCNATDAGNNPATGAQCSDPPTTTTNGVVAVGASFVQASAGACTAGKPSRDCSLQRPTFTISTAPLTSLPSTITGASIGSTVGSRGYGVLTVPSGATATFAAGTYVFCGVDANGTITTSTGGVQIFILAPGSNGCSAATTSGTATAGSFIACNGISNLLTGGGLDGVTSVVNPSAFQVYVQGDSSYQKQSADTAVTACPYSSGGTYTATSGADPDTQVYVGSSSTSLTQAFVVYAPESEVTLNTAAIFEGSAIGWNVDMTAQAVLQDFDLGNYPLSSVINAEQLGQEEQCDNSVVPLTNAPPAYSTSSPGTLTTANDLGGC